MWIIKLFFKRIKLFYLKFKYRDIDENLCCCGDEIGKGGSICNHGGCRSSKEYIISCHFKD